MKTLKLLSAFALFTVLIMYACKKADFSFQKETEMSVESKFFNSHRTGNSEENALISFLQRKNSKEHFVAKTAAQIGYPRWDKMLKKPNKKTLVVGDAAVMGTASGNTADDVYYIPFVRDSQNYVNAAMVIKTSTTDTTLSYKCDWQYKQKQNDVNSLNDAAENFAVFFMVLDNNVFGHTKFKIIDTSIFRTNNHSPFEITLTTQTNNNGIQPLMELVTRCQDITISYLPKICSYMADPTRGYCNDRYNPTVCDKCPRCWESYRTTVCWEEWEDGGDEGGGGIGGSGGDEGGGSGGGGSAPPSPCGVEQPNGTNSVHNNPETMVTFKAPCGGDTPGWEPVDNFNQNSLSPNDSIIIKLDSFPCAKQVALEMPNCNWEIKKMIADVFNVTTEVNLKLEPNYSLPDSIVGQTRVENGSLANYVAVIDLNPKYLKGSKDYIAATLIHESIHAYIGYMRSSLDSNTFKTLFPIYWEYRGNEAQHNQMSNSYINFMVNFLQNINTNLPSNVAEALAWGGLERTAIWKAKDSTEIKKILDINYRAANPTIGTADSLKIIKCD
ncbi:MAG: hypothetical protein JSR09_07585 [Bacteroidetes bacterium]|nr:hypothetical protein [Bacteroidota bacterium]MBS1639369.1 hypothetical protein [Bacteroidota bacterium]MBS1642889.1 hypothetical protein [Bacteroidota bacterium]MBS1649554.1 hypothetical protein [Bacteroidota bacterium]MBS1670376.1 hypothetical protein [Bacteroidota bacterium]